MFQLMKYILLFAAVLLSDSAPLFTSTVPQCLLDPLFCFNSGLPLFIFMGCPLVNKRGKRSRRIAQSAASRGQKVSSECENSGGCFTVRDFIINLRAIYISPISVFYLWFWSSATGLQLMATRVARWFSTGIIMTTGHTASIRLTGLMFHHRRAKMCRVPAVLFALH